MGVEQVEALRAVTEELVGILRRRVPERDTEHVVDVDLDDRRAPECRSVREPPLASGVLARRALYAQAEARRDLGQRRVELGAFGHHRQAIGGADVVHVDVDRQPREFEHEEVERRPALECEARPEERVRRHQVEQPDQHRHLLERVDGEAGVAGGALELFTCQHQATSSQRSSSSHSGTIRFHGWTSRPGSRAVSR